MYEISIEHESPNQNRKPPVRFHPSFNELQSLICKLCSIFPNINPLYTWNIYLNLAKRDNPNPEVENYFK